MKTTPHLAFLTGTAAGSALLAMAATLATAAEPLAAAPAFGDHMVLQRDAAVPVWGTAKPGSAVTVKFGGQSRKTKSSDDGRWNVVLDAMKASAQGKSMTISGGSAKLVFDDVLVGEVWICSGQSNMQWGLSKCTNAVDEIAAADHPGLRLNTDKGWMVCTPENVPRFSGVAYFFGRKLHLETGVPVGLIARALGGTPVEWWTPADKLGRVPFAKKAMRNPSPKWAEYEKAVEEWKKKRATGDRNAAGRKPQPGVSAEEGVLNGIYAQGKPGNLYEKNLAPLAGYAIRGAIWYQGERNSKAGVEAAKAYRPLLANMITSWREAWGQGDFPFLAVQLPTFSSGGEGWAIVQESQAAAVVDVPNAGYIDIRDLPDDGLHPRDKKPVGERLAALAIEKFLK